jgi:hypothetical protein
MGTAEDQRFTDTYVTHYADVLGYLLRRSSLDDARDSVSEVFTVVCVGSTRCRRMCRHCRGCME